MQEEQSLKDEGKRHGRVFYKNSVLLVFSCTSELEIVDANEPFGHFLQTTSDALIGGDLGDLGVFVDERVFKAALKRAQRREKVMNEEMLLRGNGNELHFGLVSIERRYKEKGLEFLVLIIDTTRQKEVEKELRRSQREAKELNDYLELQTARANEMAAQTELANAAKRQYLERVVKEMTEPVMLIERLSLELAQSDLLERQRPCCAGIRSGAETLAQVLEEIQDYNALVRGHAKPETFDFNLPQLLADILQGLRVQAESKALELVCVIGLDVPASLHGDGGRLRKAIEALLTSVLESTTKGEVSLVVELEREEDIHVELRFVLRNGGFSAEMGSPVAASQEGFIGEAEIEEDLLDSAVFSQVVNFLGGDLDAHEDSAEGVYSFVLGFEKRAEDSQTQLLPFSWLMGLKIILVDGSELRRNHNVELLESWGCDVSAAANLSQVATRLDMARQEEEPYQIAIIDLCTQLRDGFEAGSYIQHNSPDTYCVAMACRRELVHDSIQLSKYQHVIFKPILDSTLLRGLVKVYQLSHEDDENFLVGQDPHEEEFEPLTPAGVLIFDQESFLNRLMGDKALARTILAAFLGELPELLVSLQRAAEEADVVGVIRLVHSIKGAAANVAASALFQLSLELERAAARKDFQRIQLVLLHLNTQHRELRHAILSSGLGTVRVT